MKNIDTQLEKLLGEFSDKQRKVIDGRFGLSGATCTLQEIGNTLGVTRERVRQIEAQSIERLTEPIKQEFSWLLDAAEKFLDDVGGVRCDDYFVSDMCGVAGIVDTDNVDNKLRLIFVISGRPNFQKEKKDTHSFWYKNKKDRDKAFNFLKDVLAFFKKHGKEISKLVPMLVKDLSKLPEGKLDQKSEISALEESKSLISEEFGCSVEIVAGSNEEKARKAMPGKVGVLVE